jgi:MoaA/NifB/PqqE/SkfB family radical SAM enzyme
MLKDFLVSLFETVFKTERLHHSPALLVMETGGKDGRFVDENIVTTAIKKIMPRRLVFSGPGAHPALPELARYAGSLGVITDVNVPTLNATDRPDKKDTVCLSPWISLYIDINGEVSPCLGLFKSGIRAGNVLENSRDELLNGPVMTCIRRGFRHGNTSPACGLCGPSGGFRRLFRLYCGSGPARL